MFDIFTDQEVTQGSYDDGKQVAF